MPCLFLLFCCSIYSLEAAGVKAYAKSTYFPSMISKIQETYDVQNNSKCMCYPCGNIRTKTVYYVYIVHYEINLPS